MGQLHPPTNTAPADCACPACVVLNKQYAADPGSLAFLRRNLLRKGWAGLRSPEEKAYILAHASYAQAGAAHLAPKAPYQESLIVEVVPEDVSANCPPPSRALGGNPSTP